MTKSKDALSTIISLRITLHAKQQLLKKVEELKVQETHPFTVSEIIKIAIEKTWGIDCDSVA